MPTTQIKSARLPDFLVIGAQKAGTTSLNKYLSYHPQIGLAWTKEVHYFDLNYHRGIEWYESFFSEPSVPDQSTNGAHALIKGESSPYYIFHPHVPRRVAESLPDVKLIAILRDPVARAYSHYQHEVRHGTETLSFELAVEQEEARLAPELDRLAADESYVSFEHRHHSYLARGVYVDQLERWLQVFPRHQLLVLSAEELFTAAEETTAQAVSFLGLDRHAFSDRDAYNAGSYSALDSALVDRLKRYFVPHNERLRDLLGRDFGW